MNIDAIVDQIDVERIYKIVMDLEGPKHPLDNMEALNEAGEYILEELKSYGIKTEVHEFFVEGMQEPFKNIIGKIGDESKPAILIGSHYDTVRNSPGANDNLSSVAVSLEVARVLSLMENPPTVFFAIFTLEEEHPGVIKEVDKRLLEHGIIDSKGRPVSLRMMKFMKRVQKEILKKRNQKNDGKAGRSLTEILLEIIEELKGTIAVDEMEYLKIKSEVYQKFREKSPNGMASYSVGSYQYAYKVKKESIAIENVIVYDCLGWVSHKENTQKPLPLPKEIKDIAKLNKVDMEKSIGNFIGVIGEKNSGGIFDRFLASCESKEIDIPYYGINIPLEYDEIKKYAPDVLRSDHRAFWEMGIPGIFINDMANFRSDFYHTPADIYYYINFDMLKKIAAATVRTVCHNHK